MNYQIKQIVYVAAFAAIGLNAFADTTIYDSYPTYNGNSFSLLNGQEIGNQISLSATNWSLTGFNIEYYSPSSGASLTNVGIDVRFYLNDGAPTNLFNTPSTVFFDSGWFYNPTAGLPAGGPGTNGFHTVYYTSADFYGGSLSNMPANFLLPTNFTFTVSFTNLDAFNVVQLPLANSISNQTVQSYGDYWRNDSGAWTLLTNTAPANLVVTLTGVSVPEPSVALLGVIGSALLLSAGKLKRKL